MTRPAPRPCCAAFGCSADPARLGFCSTHLDAVPAEHRAAIAAASETGDLSMARRHTAAAVAVLAEARS